MSGISNLVGIIIIVLLSVLYFWRRYKLSSGAVHDHISSVDRYSFPQLIDYVKGKLYELSRVGTNDWGMNEGAWERRIKVRSELRQALRGCSLGDKKDKQYVKY